VSLSVNKPSLLSEDKYGRAILDRRSLNIRRRIVQTMAWGGRGHIAPALSVVEIVRVLYDDILKYDSSDPYWSERDRFILSKGHGCLAQYVMLAEKGFFPESELQNFCGFDSILGGHPEHGKIPGVEASTGALGHGPSIGVGMALAGKRDGKDYRVFVVVGDGECDEGSIWEAAMSASKHKLDNLTILIDYNKQQSYDTTFAVQDLEPFADKWQAFGFDVHEVDGHSVEDLKQTLLNLPSNNNKPAAVICHTIKGRGINFVERDLSWHHKSKVDDEMAAKLISGLEAE
jgi:transketolase